MKSLLILSSLAVALAANVLSEDTRVGDHNILSCNQQNEILRAEAIDEDNIAIISPEKLDPNDSNKITVTVNQEGVAENDQLNPEGQQAVARSLIGSLLDILLNLGSNLVGNGIRLDVGISSNGKITENLPEPAPRRRVPVPPPVDYNYDYDEYDQPPPPPRRPRAPPTPRSPPRVPERSRDSSSGGSSSPQGNPIGGRTPPGLGDITYSVGRDGLKVTRNGQPVPGVNIRTNPRHGGDDDDDDEDDDEDDEDDEETNFVYGGQVKAVEI
ncbi:hypothetical protein K501DRAFT_276587 [Backusella circina FSU 941]|nr:hypothetical protein K501DRAFT_276587 [Backusella circina FSU 941]